MTATTGKKSTSTSEQGTRQTADIAKGGPKKSSYQGGDLRRLAFWISSGLHRQMRVDAAKKDLSIQDLIQGLLTWYLQDGPGAEPTKTTEVDLWGFDVTTKPGTTRGAK